MKQALPIQTLAWFTWLQKIDSRSPLNRGFTVLIKSMFMNYKEQNTALDTTWAAAVLLPSPVLSYMVYATSTTHSSNTVIRLLSKHSAYEFSRKWTHQRVSQRIKIMIIRTSIKTFKNRDGEHDPLQAGWAGVAPRCHLTQLVHTIIHAACAHQISANRISIAPSSQGSVLSLQTVIMGAFQWNRTVTDQKWSIKLLHSIFR